MPILNILIHPNVNDEMDKVLQVLKFVDENDIVIEDHPETIEIMSLVLSYHGSHGFLPDVKAIKEGLSTEAHNYLLVGESENLAQDIRVTEEAYRVKLKDTCLYQAQQEVDLEKSQKLIDKASTLNQSFLTDGIEFETADTFEGSKWYQEIKDQPLGLKTGIGLLDELIYGVGYGRVMSVMAQTGHYKTMFGTNLVYQSLKLGYNVLLWTLELTKKELYFNILSRHSYGSPDKIASEEIKKGLLEEEQVAKVGKDFREKYGKNLMLMDQDNLTFKNYAGMRDFLGKIDEKFSFDVLLIDYLQLMKHMTSTRYRYDELNDYIIGLRNIALGFRGKTRIIIMLAQVKRSAYDKAVKSGGKYNVDDMSDTSELEKTSSYVLSLFKKSTEDQVCSYQLLKNRHGLSMPDVETMQVDPKYNFMGDITDLDDSDIYSSESVNEVISSLEIVKSE